MRRTESSSPTSDAVLRESDGDGAVMLTHDVPYVATPPPLDGQWNSPSWSAAAPLDIAHFHAQSSDHRPRVHAKLLHSGDALHVLFHVQDRYVRAACTRYGEKVCRDSCVEIFLQPRPDAGYFNFEANCGGTMLIWYVTDPTPTADGLKSWFEIPEDAARTVGVYHSLPSRLSAEIVEPTEWRLQLSIPLALLATYIGPLPMLHGQPWRANLFKCADASSKPHWASWSPIGHALNFHDPRYFGVLRFRS